MRTRQLALPTIALIGATRGMLGAGIGLLLADRIAADRRMKIGRILLAVGVASTLPLVAMVLRSKPAAAEPARIREYADDIPAFS